MTERIFHIEDVSVFTEYTTYGGVEFPRYLITRETFDQKMRKVRDMMQDMKEELAKGTPSGDAGDTHGQYHNELAWYREQDLSRRLDLAKSIDRGLDQVVIIENYNNVREGLRKVGIDPSEKVTLGSVVRIEFNGNPEDLEELAIVTTLDGGAKRGWTSIETPLATAIEGKRKGEKVAFKVRETITEVKIIEIS